MSTYNCSQIKKIMLYKMIMKNINKLNELVSVKIEGSRKTLRKSI